MAQASRPVSRRRRLPLLGLFDTLLARNGEGDDRFCAGDGEFDVVGRGPGCDTVEADAHDLVGADCERLVRK